MLLPSTSPAVAFQPEYYQTEKSRFYDGKSTANRSLSPTTRTQGNHQQRQSRDPSPRGRFRFCVCAGNRKPNKKTLTKWYIKVSQPCGNKIGFKEVE
ncbi:Rgl [Trypoxylus dichotomus]